MWVVSTVNCGAVCACAGAPGGGCPGVVSPNFFGSSAITRSPYLKTACETYLPIPAGPACTRKSRAARRAFRLGQGPERRQAPPYVPDALSVQRLAQQGKAPADVNVLRRAGFHPLRRPNASGCDRGKGPGMLSQHLAVLRPASFVELG